MDKVVHFEIPAEDTKRAQNFYNKVFGWKINEIPEMDYTIVHTGPLDENNMPKESGFINGGIMGRSGDFQHPSVTIGVEDIESALAKIKENGGEILKEKMEVGDMGWAAYFKDSEGNLTGLFQSKEM
ncbi:VOC family protein [Patescibacteria group bacterium]|nr:VOC family protein [Patescibacteria group bacterium]